VIAVVATIRLEERDGLCTITVRAKGYTGKRGKRQAAGVPVDQSQEWIEKAMEDLKAELEPAHD
jgi:hypothetical protein